MSKLRTIYKQGLKNTADAYHEGFKNYTLNIPEVEAEAKRRAEVCKGCLIEEPISFLKTEDKRIKELDGKIFECCGCSGAYKARQNVTKCDKW